MIRLRNKEIVINLKLLVKNAAARVVVRLPMSCHITPILIDLHWLPVHWRVQFRCLVFVFKYLNGLAPQQECRGCKYHGPAFKAARPGQHTTH